ncbi:MAG: hypothetical protein ACOXZ5_01485 [Syntrophomonadaceae bacterium]|jgi:hypothetical protein
MSNDIILEKVKKLFAEKYRGIPFEKVLLSFQEDLWQIADEHNTTGPEVLRIYLDWEENN